MALGTCAKCGNKVSTTARACPKCGAAPPELVFCTRCGVSMLDSESVCPSCGVARHGDARSRFEKHDDPSITKQPIAALSADAKAVETGAIPGWRCPKCSNESIQKLSVIYAEGSMSSTQTLLAAGIGDASRQAALGGAVGAVSGTSSSILAKNSAPPIAPQQPSGRAAGCATFLVAFALSWVLSFAIFALISGNDSGVSSNPSATRTDWGFVLEGFFFGLVLPLGLAIKAGSYVQRSFERSQQAEYPNKLAVYNEAMAKWQRSYFCHRCGNIFELQS